MAVGVYHQCRHSFCPFIILYAIKFHEINFNTYHEANEKKKLQNQIKKKRANPENSKLLLIIDCAMQTRKCNFTFKNFH